MPQLEQRYFRRNEGTTDYATHSSVTVDRIVMDVIPGAGNGNLGLPTGAPAATDSVLQTIDFAYSGTISELYRNGSDYFSGIIANVKYYLSGELIHSWSINSNSSTESDSVDGLVLTIINGNAADWGLFDRQADGDWLGQELVVNGGFDSAEGWTLGVGWSISGGQAIKTEAGANAINQTVDILTPNAEYIVTLCRSEPSSSQINLVMGGVYNTVSGFLGCQEHTKKSGSSSGFGLQGGDSYVIDNVSVKEVLKNA